MSQATDYTIDNSTGANVRADINTVLGAIATNNSGGSDNGSIQALGFFANTSTSKLQLKNAAGNAFINLRGFDGTLPLPDGTSSNLALFFNSDTNTGLYRPGADKINFVTGGSERLELGAVTIFNENGSDVDFRIEGDTEANLFFVDASVDRIGLGTSTPGSLLSLTGANATVTGISLGLATSSITTSRYIGLCQNGSENNLATNSGFQGVEFGGPGSASEGYLAFHTHDVGVLSSEKMRITKGGLVGIGSTDPKNLLEVLGANTSVTGISLAPATSSVTHSKYIGITAPSNGADIATNSGFQGIEFGGPGSSDEGYIAFHTHNPGTASAERARFDKNGNLGIAVTDPDQKVEVAGTVAATDLMVGRSGSQFPIIQRHTAASGSQSLLITSGSGFSTNASSEPTINDSTGGAGIRLSAGDPTSDTFGGGIQYIANGSTSPNNPGKGNQHTFFVRTAANTLSEKMRLDHLGGLRINTTSTVLDAELFSITEAGTTHNIGGFRVNNQSNTKNMINMAHVANSDDRKFFKFMRTGSLTEIGSINTNPTTTAFNTSSDYRLKENEVLISDGITRLKTLKPYRFNFKITPDKTVDGFFAHEVISAVPEAITGEKDAVETTYYTNGDTIPEGKAVGDVKEENVILPQSLDYAKFTPLLTAALQEAISKIEVLETKVAALEAA